MRDGTWDGNGRNVERIFVGMEGGKNAGKRDTIFDRLKRVKKKKKNPCAPFLFNARRREVAAGYYNPPTVNQPSIKTKCLP